MQQQLVTLATDLGSQDFLPAAIKAVVLKTVPHATVVDVTHQLNAYNFPQAAYISRSALKYFPPETLHLIFVNVFDTKLQQLILAKHNHQYIATVNNGLLSMILEQTPQQITLINVNSQEPTYLPNITKQILQTFLLAQNNQIEIPVYDEADVSNYKTINPLKPLLGQDWMEGQILMIDEFENVIVNITQKQFEEQRKGRDFIIIFRRAEVIKKISSSYADVPEGEKLALFNTAGYLEIAINKGNAAGLFGLQNYEVGSGSNNNYFSQGLLYQKVRIEFL